LVFSHIISKCHCCGKPGHQLTTCKRKNKPKEEWAINKTQQDLQNFVQTKLNPKTTDQNTLQTSNTDQITNTSATSTRTTGWVGAHAKFVFFRSPEMQDWILLDNQSSITAFSNKNLVNNIRETDYVLDQHTNGGILTTKMKCDIPNWGEAWYSLDAITNIFSFAETLIRVFA
jgi:hypothetical protein